MSLYIDRHLSDLAESQSKTVEQVVNDAFAKGKSFRRAAMLLGIPKRQGELHSWLTRNGYEVEKTVVITTKIVKREAAS